MVVEVHPVNLPLFWILSFFAHVTVYRLHPRCPGFLSRRIEVADLEEYFTQNASHCVRSEALSQWEKMLEKFPDKEWQVRHRGLFLDFSTKAKQTLSVPFERLMILRQIQDLKSRSSKAYIVNSLESQYIKRFDPSSEYFDYAAVPIVSRINVVLDCLYLYVLICQQAAMVLAAMLIGGLSRHREENRSSQTVSVLWNAVSPNELSLEPDKRSFPWIVDGENISSDDVLFILPRTPMQEVGLDRSPSNYRAFTVPELYRIVSMNILLRNVLGLIVALAKYLLPIPRGLVATQKAAFLVRVSRLQPIAEHYEPINYVTSISDLGVEDSAVVYLQATGVKTVMYSYSATFHHPGGDGCTCDFRNVLLSNLLASELVVWHKDAQHLFQEHPQIKTDVKVIGPIMAGDESIFESPKSELRARAGVIPGIERDDYWYLSVFDLTPKSRSMIKQIGFLPNVYTEKYLSVFLEDIHRLMEEFERMVVVFKPQSSFSSSFHSYSQEFLDTAQSIIDSQRGFVLDETINPWLPIAVADACVAIPFTVPPLAGMHYGIPGIFHDPTGFVQNHRHGSISNTVTHSYEQLSEKIASLMADEDSQDDRHKAALWSEAQYFIGEHPGTNSSERFRKLLLESGQR